MIVTDDMVEAALLNWYESDWLDLVAANAGTFVNDARREMRHTLEAAIAASEEPA